MSVSRSRDDDLHQEMKERIKMEDLLTRRPEALETMARTLQAPLHRFVSRLVAHDADSEDIVQQTYTAILRKIDAFEGTVQNFRSWVFTIAYRAAMDVLRSRRRIRPLSEDELPDRVEPPTCDPPVEELHQAFRRLSPEEQSLLTLKYQDDFSNSEIANILELTPNHVGVLMYRAKQNLRKALS